MHKYHGPLPVFLVAVAALGVVTPLRAQSAATDTMSAQDDSAAAFFRAGQAAYRENTGDGRLRAITAWEEAARRFGSTGRPRNEANTLSWICRARKEQGPSASALASCRVALRAYEAAGTPADLGKTHSRLGDLHLALSQPDSALPHYRSASLYYRQAGDSVNAGPAMEQVALIHNRAGRTDSALAAFAELVVLRRWALDTAGEAAAHHWLGSLYRKRGDSKAALEHYRTSMLLYAAIGQDSVARGLHLSLGEVFDSLGLDDSTRVHLTSALGTPPPRSIAGEAWALRQLALLHLKHNAPDTALVLFREAQARYHQSGDTASEAWALGRIGSLHYTANRLDSAVVAYTAAAKLRHEIHDSAGEARAHDWLGWIQRKRGESDTALTHYRMALPLYAAAVGDTAVRRIHRDIGAIFEDQKLLDSATTHQVLSVGLPLVGSRDDEARLLRRLGDRYLDRGVADTAIVHLNAALRLVDAGADSGARKYLLRSLGLAYEKLEQYDSAATAFSGAVAIGRVDGDSAIISAASGFLGGVEFDRRHFAAALAAYRDAVAWYSSDMNGLYLLVFRTQLDRLLAQQSRLDSLRAAYAVVRPLYAGLRPEAVRRQAFGGLDFLLDLGLTDSAIANLTESPLPGTAHGDRAAEIFALRTLADAFIDIELPDSLVARHRGIAALLAAGTGSLESAAARYRQAIARLGPRPDSAAFSAANTWLSIVETARHRNSAAIAAYRNAIRAWPSTASSRELAGLHAQIGQLLEKAGELDSMKAHYQIATDGGRGLFSDSALVQLNHALGLATKAKPAVAIPALLKAAELMQRKGSQGLRNVALLRVALLYRDIGQFDSALAYSNLVLASWHRLGVPSEEASALMTVSGIHMQRGEFDSAIVYSGRGLALAPAGAEPRLIATLHGVRSVAFSSSGRYDSALVNARGAVAAWRGANNPESLARSLGHLGSIFSAVGQFDSAVTYHRAMRDAAQTLSQPSLAATALHHLAGDFESAGAIDSALAAYRTARDLSHSIPDPRGEAAELERIGRLLTSRGETDSAATALIAALTTLLGASDSGMADRLNDIASLYERTGEADSALAYRRRARDLARATGDRASLDLALVALGRLETDRGHPSEGLAALREALDRQRGSSSLEQTAAILGNIGFTLRRLPAPDLSGALAAFDTASVYRTRVRQEAGGDENKLSIGEQFTLPPGEWELAWLALAPKIGPEAAALGALAAAERTRAQSLLDLMRGTTTARKPGADLVAEGRRLVNAASADGTTVLYYLSTEDSLLVWYARPGIPVITRVVPVGADSLARLVGSWRRALGVDHADVGARLAGPEGRPLEESLRSGAAGGITAAGDPSALGGALAALILPEELRRVARRGNPRELVIVTHGPLTVIPFGALPLADPAAVLAERNAIRYAPSLTSLVEVERGTPPLTAAARAAKLKQSLVVGDPAMPAPRNSRGERMTLPALPAAALEGRAVAARVGVTALTGTAASERTIRDRMPAAPLIHLATHGYAYAASGQARNSFVALAPDSTDDGLLTVGEVLDDPRLKLTADLVVLSACQTGLGNLKQAEGTVGLQRAFMARGARSLLVSLWSVSDEATALLMARFYQHWLGDRDQPPKSEALRRAQADVRDTKGYEAPRFWAPFQLVGGR